MAVVGLHSHRAIVLINLGSRSTNYRSSDVNNRHTFWRLGSLRSGASKLVPGKDSLADLYLPHCLLAMSSHGKERALWLFFFFL
jgi:hypothetical protein